jgi:NAD(P)-dependent dehydrogenase (short-subunit alcohol dehydrogenase family)
MSERESAGDQTFSFSFRIASDIIGCGPVVNNLVDKQTSWYMSNFAKLFDLTGRTALITGGGAGFGRSIALGFADYGCQVAVADIDFAKAEGTAREVCRAGVRCLPLQVDVAEPDAIVRMADETEQHFGTVDILVNSAGIPQHDPAESTPVATWDHVLDVNLRGTFLCCQAAGRMMLRKGGGAIINFSSVAGVVGMGRGTNAYCASKGGVNTLTKQLALEWASRGIRVNAIAPCQFLTPGLEEVMEDRQFDRKALMDTWTANIPLGRIGQQDEIVGPALFLASDASSMVTGVILPVDGGYLAR